MKREMLSGAAGALLLVTAGALAQDLERGRLLHENHCRMCHDSVAYKRGDHIAKDLAGVRAQVVRWETNTGLRWSQDEVDDVTAYVAQQYYKGRLSGEKK